MPSSNTAIHSHRRCPGLHTFKDKLLSLFLIQICVSKVFNLFGKFCFQAAILSLSSSLFSLPAEGGFHYSDKGPAMLKKIAQRDPKNPSTQQKSKSFSLQYHISSNRHGCKDLWDQVFIFIRGSYLLSLGSCAAGYISFRCRASGPALMCPVRVRVKLCTGQAITKQSSRLSLAGAQRPRRSHRKGRFPSCLGLSPRAG